ncbi:integrase arm-type DNA-binding domain-containing protein [Nitratireductor aquibiodomus]|uniref:tyrosine-type recombinase/integrase n=1 Tax=Nitratireductor aquibiodomus TaxID=204799 RepID=UPI0019D3E524|nr:site-specific integrase [Nitratireductor aquibiodomus]MBN7759978.1 integrase arm-type DNA-binding domain-containing protein [Nitratireductor aquibiodomus]
MARHKLSESRIRTLSKAGIYSDGDGLYLRVRDGGSKQWRFIFKRAGKRTEIALGGYGQGTAPVSLALAREKADAIRERLARGEDLAGRKTFLDVMEDVIAVKEAGFRNEKHKAQWRMTLDKYAEPLHRKPIADITRDDIVETLKPIWTKIPETADRTRMRIAAVLDHAKARGLFTGDNPADWRGGLKELLPARQKLTRGHHAAVPYSALPGVMERLRASTGTAARAVEFAALTAARSGEVRNATWSEVDLDEALWTIPAERMKAGKPHEVPLSDRAVSILKARRQMATSGLVFEGGKEGVPISDTAMTKALRAAGGGGATLHGLRSTFRDWAGDCTNYPRDVAEAALAHVVSDKTEAAYRRGTALAKRRNLMEDWSGYCSKPC